MILQLSEGGKIKKWGTFQNGCQHDLTSYNSVIHRLKWDDKFKLFKFLDSAYGYFWVDTTLGV